MAKVKLDQDITIQKAYKDISEENWDKVILHCTDSTRIPFSLNKFNFQNSIAGSKVYNLTPMDASGQVFSFASDEVVRDIKDVFPRAEGYVISRDTVRGYGGCGEGKGFSPSILCQQLLHGKNDVRLGGGNDLFDNFDGKGRLCKIKNWKVFNFLKKYGNDSVCPITYKAGVEYDENDFNGFPDAQSHIIGRTTPAPTPTPPSGPTPEQQELNDLKAEWDKDFAPLFTGDKGLTIDNLKKLKEIFDKANNNFAMCQKYTGQLVGNLADAGVEDNQIPPAPNYETEAQIEVAPK